MKQKIPIYIGLVIAACFYGYSFLGTEKEPIQKSNYVQIEEIALTEVEPEETNNNISHEEEIPNYTEAVPQETASPLPSETPKPTIAPKPTPTQKPSIRHVGQTVYITKSGKKFHREDCSSLSKSKIPILFEEACEKNYEPCGRCKP